DRYDLRAQFVFQYVRGGPVAFLSTFDAPDLLPRRPVQGDHERSRFVVVDDVQAVLVEDGRGPGAPVAAHRVTVPALLPKRLAVHRVAEDADIGEVNVDPFAVGDWRLGSVRVAGMTRLGGHSLVRLALPDDLARIEVEAIGHPPVRVGRPHKTTR